MFNVELKFTVDCINNWFSKNLKVQELDVDQKKDFRDNNSFTPRTLYCLCDFPMTARAENGWAMHVFKAEHLFLENIYSEKDMQKMDIDNFKIITQYLFLHIINFDLTFF